MFPNGLFGQNQILEISLCDKFENSVFERLETQTTFGTDSSLKSKPTFFEDSEVCSIPLNIDLNSKVSLRKPKGDLKRYETLQEHKRNGFMTKEDFEF